MGIKFLCLFTQAPEEHTLRRKRGEEQMKRKTAAVLIGMMLSLAGLIGCGAQKDAESAAQETEQRTETDAESDGQDASQVQKEAETDGEETAQSGLEGGEGDAAADDGDTEPAKDSADAESSGEAEGVCVRVGSLKGPTSMGLVYLMEQAEQGATEDQYEFTMTAAADELLPAMISGDLDIALLPANVASVLYMKTEGGVSVIDINTLGVLYMVSGDDTIAEMEDLKGRTIYLTGKGTTPDYVMQYLLKENGLTPEDVTLEYKSEATEIAVMLAEMPDAIGVLPQPFVTAACAQNEELAVVMDLTQQWAAVQKEGGSSLVTGVTVVRSSFLAEHEDAVVRFMEGHAASAAYANEHVEEAAELVAAAGIIEKAPVAAKAMPQCNITYIDGEEMKTALSGYLAVLFEQDAASVGGGLPGDTFYFIKAE